MANSNSAEAWLPNSLRIPEALTSTGACIDTSPTVMDGETIPNILAAREICSGCPVAKICLDWAVWHEPSGVWAGLTPKERKKLRGNAPLIDIVEILQLTDYEQNLFSGKAIKALASEYNVTERTIYRWRADLARLKETS